MEPLGGRGAAGGGGGGGKWFYPVISLLQPVFVFFVVISSVFLSLLQDHVPCWNWNSSLAGHLW